MRLRPGPPEAGGRDIEQIGVEGLQLVGAEAQPVHDTRSEIFDHYVAARGERPRDRDRFRLLQVEHDTSFRLAENRVQLGGTAGVAASGRLDLQDLRAHRREIARRRRARDDPAEIENADAGEGHRSAAAAGRIAAGSSDPQPERRSRHLDRPPPELDVSPELAVLELRRRELFRRLAQRKARHMSGLGAVGNPLLAALAAPPRHQRMEQIPVGNPVGLGREARVTAPVGRTHYRQPRRPLTLFARRDRDIPVAGRQNRDRGPVAVRLALARAGSSSEPGARQLGYGHRRQRVLDRDIDDRAGRGQCRVHAGAGGGKAADEGGLSAHRADRRFREIVYLPGQQPGNAARKEQRQVSRRVVGFWSGLSKG